MTTGGDDGDDGYSGETDDNGREATVGAEVDPSTNGAGRADAAGRVSLAADTQTDGVEQRSLTERTTDRRSISAQIQLYWGLQIAAISLVVGIFAAGALSATSLGARAAPVVAGGLLVVGTVWVVLRYQAWVYQLRADALYMERGVATHVRSLVPYVRIQHVDTSRGPLERTLGLSTLVVYTAGSRGADVSIPGLTPEEADELQQRLKQLAIDAEGNDAV